MPLYLTLTGNEMTTTVHKYVVTSKTLEDINRYLEDFYEGIGKPVAVTYEDIKLIWEEKSFKLSDDWLTGDYWFNGRRTSAYALVARKLVTDVKQFEPFSVDKRMYNYKRKAE